MLHFSQPAGTSVSPAHLLLRADRPSKIAAASTEEPPVQAHRCDGQCSEKGARAFWCERCRRAALLSAIRQFRKRTPLPPDSAEAAYLKSLERAPLYSNDSRRDLFEVWKDERSTAVMQKLVLICATQQARRLLRKENVGEGILDMLHDAVVGLLEEFERETFEDVSAVGWKSLFSALRARQMHIMRMRRIARTPASRETRAATSLLIDTPLDHLGDHDPRWFENVARDAEVGEAALMRIWAIFVGEDTDNLPDQVTGSHEEDCLVRHDMASVLGSLEHVLDARSAEVVRRRWLDEEEAEVIAADLGISDARVRQIDRAAIRALQELYAPDSLREKQRQAAGVARLKAQAGRVVLHPTQGVDLARAEPVCAKMLHPLQEKVIRARFYSGPEVVPLADVASDLGLDVEDAAAVEKAALARLRAEFPAEIAVRHEKLEKRYARKVKKAAPAGQKTPSAQKAAPRKSASAYNPAPKRKAAPVRSATPAFDRGPLSRRGGSLSFQKGR